MNLLKTTLQTTRPTIGALLAAALLAAGCTQPRPSDVPAELAPPAGQAWAMTVTARGVQRYECRAGSDGAPPAWAFVAPEAELLDASGGVVGQHGAGPTWQAADGSRIVGQVRARADAPVPTAIPWLLLATQASGPEGSFSRIRSVQRIDTIGGTPPSQPCTQGNVGETARVPYSARYRFFAQR